MKGKKKKQTKFLYLFCFPHPHISFVITSFFHFISFLPLSPLSPYFLLTPPQLTFSPQLIDPNHLIAHILPLTFGAPLFAHGRYEEEGPPLATPSGSFLRRSPPAAPFSTTTNFTPLSKSVLLVHLATSSLHMF